MPFDAMRPPTRKLIRLSKSAFATTPSEIKQWDEFWEEMAPERPQFR